MVYWFCNFQEFERKKIETNRLALNFYYVPDKGEEARSMKFFARTDVKIPTGFIHERKTEDIKKIKEALEQDPNLNGFLLEEKKHGKFHVLQLHIPNEKKLKDKVKKISSKFQVGDYDKLLKLGGFFPDRKVVIPSVLEQIINSAKTIETKKGIEKEIDLFPLYGLFENHSLTSEELLELPKMFWDIEKPLWKKPYEKNLIERRKMVLGLRGEEKYNNLIAQSRIEKITKRLEDRLTIEVDKVGKVGLWKEGYDAKVSHISVIWKNCNNEKYGKSLLVLDPNDEVRDEQINGFEIITFKTEKQLIAEFTDMCHEKKPVASVAYNGVYDATQVRFAGEKLKIKFDPAIKGVQPRRDFVRKFYQRMRPDLMYFDPMRLNDIWFPWLKQRSLGTSLKLEAVSKFHGLDFTKELTHEDLRTVNLQAFFGKTKEVRVNAHKKLMQYAAGDVEPLQWMMENLGFYSLLSKLKEIMPYCTYTELSFSTGCVDKYLDKKHFDRTGNKRFTGEKQKIRQNELQIFKKRFPSLKKKMLQHTGIETKQVKGKHENVYELYLPLEEWLINTMTRWAPEFWKLNKQVDEDEKIAYLQYVKELQKKNMLNDYYFARREGKIFQKKGINTDKFIELEKRIEKETIDSFLGSFERLKKQFRSIYVAAVKVKKSSLLRTTQKNLSQVEIPEIMEKDVDLYLLREHAQQIYPYLTKAKKSELTRFLSNFESFESLWDTIREQVIDLSETPQDFVFLYNQYRRKSEREAKFNAQYKISVPILTQYIARAYGNLADELKKYNAKVVDMKGDYLFVTADEKIKESKLVYTVREFQELEIGKVV